MESRRLLDSWVLILLEKASIRSCYFSHKIIIVNVFHDVFDNRQLFADIVKSLKI